MGCRRSWLRRGPCLPAALGLVALMLAAPVPVRADTLPPVPNDPANPVTVGANPLPTVQIGNGVVWSQAIVGNTVYVGGQFSTARPAGAAPGTGEVTRSNLLAYDLRTGVLLTVWAPSTNATVDAVVASPDGTRIYVGGSFTSVNGQPRNRIAALNATTGSLISTFNPNSDSRVRALVATNSTVYLGGTFGRVAGATRSRLAAVRAADGGLLPWAPVAAGGSVRAMAISPDSAQVLVGGQFTTLNGSGNPGYGLGSLDAVTGALRPWVANGLVRNGGNNAAINSLYSAGDSVYATGFVFGSGGNLEGLVKMSWATGSVSWVADCHGDTYGAARIGDAVYGVGHSHFCGNIPGGFHQSDPWKFFRGVAFSNAATGTLGADYLGYFNWVGNPAPSILQWNPDLVAGSFTGQTQAAWSLASNGQYLVAGGEFPTVDGVAQQGLVRFALPGVAGNPNSEGPSYVGSNAVPTVTSPGAGQVLVSWRTNWDRDNRDLTYRVIRNGNVASPAHTVTAGSIEWDRRHLSFLDSGLTPGSTVSYRIFAADAFGNESRSDTVSVTVSGSGSVDAYARSVLADGPMDYWRFDEASGAAAADFTGRDGETLTGGVTRGVPGAVPGNRASRFDGTPAQTGYNAVAQPGPFWYSVETWFQTTTTRGGKIVGFGSQQTGSSPQNTYDRHLYMDNRGRINFGTRQSTYRLLTSPASYNNGQWHHAVGVVGRDGMSLYVDGSRVGNRTDTTTGRSFTGYWRIGGDNLASWNNRPTSDYFAGSIDEVAVYTHALTGGQVLSHFQARNGTVPPANQPPVAAFTSSVTGLVASFDSSGSADPDGSIVSRSWSFGDGTTGTGSNPAHTYATAGTFTVTLTVTDNQGATGSVSHPVTTVGGPSQTLVADAFGRTQVNGWGSADTGGAWTVTGTASRFAVGGGVGTVTLATAGLGPWAYLNSASVGSVTGTVEVSSNKVPAGSGASFTHSVALRRVGTSEYRFALKQLADGTVQLSTSRVVAGVETKLGVVTVPGLTYVAGDRLRLSVAAQGSGTTTLAAKVWKVGTAEPAGPQISRTDSTAGLQGPGAVGLQSYLAGSTTNAPLVASWDNLLLQQ